MKHFKLLYKQNRVAFYVILVLLALVISLPIFVTKLSSIQKLSSRPRASEPQQEYLCISPEIKGECFTSCPADGLGYTDLKESLGCSKGKTCCRKNTVLPFGKLYFRGANSLPGSTMKNTKKFFLINADRTVNEYDLSIKSRDYDNKFILSPDNNYVAYFYKSYLKESSLGKYQQTVLTLAIDNLYNSNDKTYKLYDSQELAKNSGYFREEMDDAVWSPDGNKLAVFVFYEGQLGTKKDEIYIIDIQKGTIQVQEVDYNIGDFYQPIWSKDSNSIIFIKGWYDAYSLDVTGNMSLKYSLKSKPYLLTEEKIAYVKPDGIYYIDKKGNEYSLISSDDKKILDLLPKAWQIVLSPDESKLAVIFDTNTDDFGADLSPWGDIYIFDLENRSTFNRIGNGDFHGWSPDSKWVLYTDYENNDDIDIHTVADLTGKIQKHFSGMSLLQDIPFDALFDPVWIK